MLSLVGVFLLAVVHVLALLTSSLDLDALYGPNLGLLTGSDSNACTPFQIIQFRQLLSSHYPLAVKEGRMNRDDDTIHGGRKSLKPGFPI